VNWTQAKARADVLKALGHPVRVLMLEMLSKGDRCEKDMRRLATISQPSISRHLSWLKRAGIVTERRAGARVIHHLACPDMLQALKCAANVVRSKRKQNDNRL